MNYGNIASAVVLDALRRAFDEGTIEDGSTGMIAGFGPGITAEACVGTWIATSGSRPVQGARNGMTDIENGASGAYNIDNNWRNPETLQPQVMCKR